jgi:hypothetical protein
MAEHHPPAQGGFGTDVEEHQRTFESFIRFWVYVFGAAIVILLFLAIFNA